MSEENDEGVLKKRKYMTPKNRMDQNANFGRDLCHLVLLSILNLPGDEGMSIS